VLPVFVQPREVEDQTGPGTVSNHSVPQLETILDTAKALLATADPSNEALPHVFYMTGSTARMLPLT
jgi:hypothetical protein